MNIESLTPPSTDRFRRNALLAVIAVGLLATLGAWYVLAARAPLSSTLLAVQVVTAVVLSLLFIVAWCKWLPQRVLELCCLLYIVGVCGVCMALRLYSPTYGAGIHIQPLYLWIPVIYLFAFMLTNHTAGLVLSLGIWALLVAVSLPYLMHGLDGVYANFTLQLDIVSATTIVLLYFFSSYQYRLRLAQAAMDRLARLSNTDDLTKLSNRRQMATVIVDAAAQFAKGGDGFAVMLFDIDNFKAVNDRFGHGAGDRALVALAACAMGVFRVQDALGRWGGDEFLALVRDVDYGGAMRVANALCARIGASPLPDGLHLSISCGVTVARAGDNIDSLLQRADVALYAAKRRGRNRVEGVAEH